jgi:hypothetical protein
MENTDINDEMFFIDVPKAIKDRCVKYGAKWSKKYNKWYIAANSPYKYRFEQVELYVEYKQKEEAKEAGAIWKTGLKKWVCLAMQRDLIEKYRFVDSDAEDGK